MKELLIYLLEVTACSAALLLAYTVLLERRTAFRSCRMFLLGSMIAAALIPAFSIPVWEGEVIYLPLDGAAGGAAPQTAVAAAAEEPSSLLVAILTLYGAGVLVCFGSMVRQVVRIHRLKKGAHILRHDNYDIVLTRADVASFSFFGTIYLPKSTPEAEISAIVTHELSHIRHRHSAERLVMECIKALLWWNPFARIAARRLTEVEEYEADRDVLTQGYDPSEYIAMIFKTLFGYHPNIANGLRDSLTKKRLQMMTKPSSESHALLRLAATLPILALLLASFAFTSRATEIRLSPDGVADPILLSADGELLRDPENALPSTATTVGTVQKHVTVKTEAGGSDYVAMASAPAAGTARSQQIEVVSDSTNRKNGDAEERYRKSISDPDTYLIAEQMPLFEGRGTLQDFQRWADARAAEYDGSGKVILTFVVEKDGSVAKVQVLDTPDPAMGEAAARIVASSPAWKAGTIDGQPVRVRYTLPVRCGKQVAADESSRSENRSENKIVVKVRNADFKASEALVFIDDKEAAPVDMEKIDPNTIERISVLKDSSAVARYGDRGKHGAILIRTKQ